MSEPHSTPPSMREVAALAGVSHQTVSRVINGHPSIRPETRERVLRVIEDVGYRPNSAARALATRRTRRIGVIVDSAIEYGPNATLRGIEQSARDAGYSVSSVTVGEGRSDSAHAAVDHLLAHGIDAVCIIAPRSASVDLIRARVASLPAIAVTSHPEAGVLTVSVDQVRGATLAVEHLVDAGHREIAHVAGPMDWLDAQGRARGWRAILEGAGLRVREPLIGDWTADSGYAIATSSAWPSDVTAVFCANDHMALGLLHGLSQRGVRVPADVSVVGFDDVPEARHFAPPLTTVSQDFHRLGQRTVDALIAAIEGQETARRTLIDPELVIRESTAPR